MANTTDQDLAVALHNYTVTIMKQSNPYLTKETISRKVLRECADILMIDLNCNGDKNLMYVHNDNMGRIDSKWQSLSEKGIKIMHDEQNTYKIVKSSDFVNIIDIQKLVSILMSKNEEDFINELLAVDGFQGSKDVKNYIENLRIGDKENGHVQTVRKIYAKLNVSVKVMYLALLKIYQPITRDDEIKQLVLNTIQELEEQEMVDREKISDVMDLYENSVSDIETIALTKLAQLKNRSKKLKSVKRKLRNVMKDSKKSKSDDE